MTTRWGAVLIAVAMIFVGVGWSGVAGDVGRWQTAEGYRYSELGVAQGGRAGFRLMAGAATGVMFTNLLKGDRGLTNQVLMNGAGVACGDFDGDGWCDLYFCGLDAPNALYRNLGGWKFEEVAQKAGVACADQASTGAAFADVDGDGDLDLLVNGIGRGTRLFVNEGSGRFRERTTEAGLSNHSSGTSLALADVEGDGDLDLYVANYRADSIQDEAGVDFRVSVKDNQATISMINGRPATVEDQARFQVNPMTMGIEENGEPDVLYLNDGGGKFTAVSWTGGAFTDEDGKTLTAAPADWSLTAMFRDMNGDRAPDIYVCGDTFSPDRIWLNRGGGKFQAMPKLALRHIPLSSMAVDFADINRDGLDDFFVVDMLSRLHSVRHRLLIDRHGLPRVGLYDDRPQFARNMLYLNRGDGSYAEIAHLAGLEASDWSWSPVFVDVDLDGYEDLLITSGLERSLRDADARRHIDNVKASRRISKQEIFELRKTMPALSSPTYAFRNRGDLTFENVSPEWNFEVRQLSQTIALADLDNDGDSDVVVNCMNAAPLLFRNETSAARVAVRLTGEGRNKRGIGAKIRVLGGPTVQSQEMICGGRYLSCDDTMRVFAAGKAAAVDVEVEWRSGSKGVFKGLKANRLFELRESSGAALAKGSGPEPVAPFFTDASEVLRHVHPESEFNDFERQALLPQMLSRMGPGLSWFDFDGDGREDLFVGCGRGAELGVFLNTERAGFKRINLSKLTGAFSGDVSTILGVPSEAEGTSLILGISNHETGSAKEPSIKQYERWAAGLEQAQAWGAEEASVGHMALGDLDGDGTLELFAGGRSVPGRYPEPADSHVYRKAGGKWVLDGANDKAVEKAGLVSGAVFTDLNNDGFAELVLAREWGPLKILWNEKGKLVDATERLGFTKYLGWWSSVTSGDFDGDGRQDLVAGNGGRNTKHQYYARHPIKLFYGDINGDGSVQAIEAHYEPAMKKDVPWRFWDTLGKAMPMVQIGFPSFAAYSQAGVEEIFAERKEALKVLSVNTVESMVFLNRGGRFEAQPLPLEAQLSPVFGLVTADFDGDGNEDVFASQNFFGVDAETSRYDSGLGVWLRGDGHGNFKAVAAAESGVRVHGEGRGVAVCDYDGDGRVDLAVGQNGASTKLYHNERAKPGVGIRLNGPAGNRSGVGAVLQWVTGNKAGPAREIHAGAGYWSQDGAVQVLATPEGGTKLQVRWPGGKTVAVDCPAAAQEIVVDFGGTVKVVR